MTDDLRTALERVVERFDLGEYEVEAYLAVLQHGELTASGISAETDVPQPRVYDTVRDLAEVGLVEIRESRPMKVLAVDPREAFEPVQTSLDRLVERLGERYTAPAREPEAVSLVKSRETIRRYLESVIEDADYELTLSLTPDLLEEYADRLADRRAAGVATDVLLSPASAAPEPSSFDYEAVASAVVGRRGVTTPVVAVADGRYSLYASRESLTGDGDRYGVIFNRSTLGFLVSGFLNTVLWTTAEPIYEADPSGFPRHYGTMRRCIADLRSADGSFRASIQGRDVESGEPRSVEGPVLDASFGPNREVATLVIGTDGGRVRVGGQVAALEDVEAHEIVVERTEER